MSRRANQSGTSSLELMGARNSFIVNVIISLSLSLLKFGCVLIFVLKMSIIRI